MVSTYYKRVYAYPPLDSAAYTCMLVSYDSYRRLSLLFQFSVSVVTKNVSYIDF
jgi:hypothetical protein